MSTKFIIHVGAPKTGTSYLERIIWPERERLLADGIWMPGKSRRAHDALMGEVRGSVWRDPDSRWTWERVIAEARAHEAVLISKEMLSGAPQEQVDRVRQLLEGFELHIIVTCRALSATLPSTWQQNVKAGQTHRFGEFLTEINTGGRPSFWRHHDPYRIIRRWGADIPAEQLHVVTMPADRSDPTLLWKRFASALGVEPGAYRTPERPENESLGAVEAEYLRRLNVELDNEFPLRTPWMDHVHAPLVRDVLLRPDIMGDQPRRKFGVRPPHRGWVVTRSQRMIERLASYPCTIVGDLGDLEPRIDPEAASPDDVTEAELAEFGLRVSAQLLRNQAAARAAAGPTAPIGRPARLLRRLGRASRSLRAPRARRSLDGTASDITEEMPDLPVV